MIVEKYKAADLAAIDLQEGQQYIGKYVAADHAAMLETYPAFTGLHNGRVLICSGLIELWPGRALVWTYMDKQAGAHMLAIHRAAVRLLDAYQGERLEADVDVDFEPGHRWVKMLGFELETERMRRYRPDGGDCAKYVRIK